MNPWIKHLCLKDETKRDIKRATFPHFNNAGTYQKEWGKKRRHFESRVFSKMKPEQCLRQPGGGKVRHKVVARHIERENGFLFNDFR